MAIKLVVLDKNPTNETQLAKLVFGNMQPKINQFFKENFPFHRLSNHIKKRAEYFLNERL